MPGTNDPQYPNWNQEATASEQKYSDQDPARVAAELLGCSERIAKRFEGVTGRQWERTESCSDGATFTVASFARYFLNDPVHHLHDFTSALAGGSSWASG